MTIEECNEGEWGDLLAASPQATIYNTTAFLRSYGAKVKSFLYKQGRSAIAGIAYVEANNCNLATLPFQSYSGLLFRDLRSFPLHKRTSMQFAATEAFADWLFSFSSVDLVNHWEVCDVRPFLWKNFDCEDLQHFDVEVRYTSLLRIDTPVPSMQYRQGRRYSIKKSERHGLTTVGSSDVGALDELHRLTFSRQSIERSNAEAEYLQAICSNLLSANCGKLYLTLLGQEPVSASFFGIDERRAYYIFGASHPEYRSTECGSRNVSDAISNLKAIGVQEVDFVGVNSPNRGDFKLSFGGSLVPHFRVRKT